MISNPLRALAGAVVLLFVAACTSSSSEAPQGTAGKVAGAVLPGGTPIELTLASPADGALVASPPGSVMVAGTVSVADGAGQPATALVYLFDATAATSVAASCAGGTTVLGCEVAALSALNAAAITAQTVRDVGAVIFGSHGAALDVAPTAGAQALTAPGADLDGTGGPDVVQAMGSVLPGAAATVFEPVSAGTGAAQVASGLATALGVAASSTAPTKIVVLLSASDAQAQESPPAGAVVRAFALPGTSCVAGLAQLAALGAPGSGCVDVPDLAALASQVTAVLDATLASLDLAVDGGAPIPLDPAGIPTQAPCTVPFTTLVTGLAPGVHELCVTATATDPGGLGTVEECASVKVATIALAPSAATYELGTPGQTATVTATIAAGEAGGVPGVDVDFLVTTGPNAGKSGTVKTGASGQAAFTYTARQHLEGLGTDTIVACFADSAGTKACAAATVKWQDTTAPVVACLPGPNPGGVIVTKQGGVSPSGFMLLVATDAVDPVPVVFLIDTGSGVVRGPWDTGKAVKYTQAPGGPPSAKEMGSDEGGGLEILHVKGNGDPAVRGKDASGNESQPLVCPVPPWQK